MCWSKNEYAMVLFYYKKGLGLFYLRLEYCQQICYSLTPIFFNKHGAKRKAIMINRFLYSDIRGNQSKETGWERNYKTRLVVGSFVLSRTLLAAIGAQESTEMDLGQRSGWYHFRRCPIENKFPAIYYF